jgi:hypothetical protein
VGGVEGGVVGGRPVVAGDWLVLRLASHKIRRLVFTAAFITARISLEFLSHVRYKWKLYRPSPHALGNVPLENVKILSPFMFSLFLFFSFFFSSLQLTFNLRCSLALSLAGGDGRVS